jgi:hypothetical protein
VFLFKLKKCTEIGRMANSEDELQGVAINWKNG